MKFNFKEFAVYQTYSAAKITTDATIFAAWMPVSEAYHILEIGTGTGVMSLMLAQRCSALIDAVEIEELAYQESSLNFSNAPFNDRLKVFHTSIQSYKSDKSYDLIFSNPPFFNNNLLSDSNNAKNTAYHTVQLSFSDLANSIERLLNDNGLAFVMLPVYESELFDKEMAILGYQAVEMLFIRHSENKPPLRRIVGYSKLKNHPLNTSVINIRNLQGDFDDDYKALLTPYLTIF